MDFTPGFMYTRRLHLREAAASHADRSPHVPRPSRWSDTEARARLPVVALVGVVVAALAPIALPRVAATQVTKPGPAHVETNASGRRSDTARVDALVSRALTVNPTIRAAAARVEAARARIARAGTRPDPMLMAGIQNFPLTEPGFDDFMTMKMVGVGQTFPYPGKLSLRRRAAERELASARAELDRARREVVRDVKAAYYDLAYLDRALEIVARNRLVLLDFIKTTEARYAVGAGQQQDVLRARVEAASLGEEATALHEERRAVLARLNAALDRPSATPVVEPSVPAAVARAAVADSAARIRFVSPTLGSRAADSPLPSLAALQDLAVKHSPMLRAHEAEIAAQSARVELARKEHLPDFDVSLQYGQRDGFSDMVTAMISVPVPLQKGRQQDQLVAEARAELSALQAEHHARQNMLRAEVARLYSELERERAQLALYKKAILPQARASLEAAVVNYQVGRANLLTLLESQTTLFNYETAYHRALANFAKTLAELEQVIGKEILT